jgi:hypothetical protein
VPTSFDELIPELPRWNNGSGIDVEDWIGCIGNFEHLIGYVELIWPRFVEHEGCILHEGFSVEGFRGFMEQARGDKRSVEAVMNHLHIADLFSTGRPTEAQVIHVGHRLKEIWSAKLTRDFPDRNVEVSFTEGPFEDVVDYEITWYQPDHAR